jgi:hypothetical protein
MPVSHHQHSAAANRPKGIGPPMFGDFINERKRVAKQAFPWPAR